MRLRLLGLAFILMSFVALGGLKAQDASDTACPRSRSNEPCIQVIAYAQNPGTGQCCQFANPCSVPPGWGPAFFSQEACEAA